MKYTILVFLLTTATNFISMIPIGEQHSAVYQEAHYRLPPPQQPPPPPPPLLSRSIGLYAHPRYSVVPELSDHANRNKWMESPNTRYAVHLTWPEEEIPAGDTYVHLYHLSGKGVVVPPNPGMVQNEWTPYSESYPVHPSLLQAYGADYGRYGSVWNQGALQAAYGGLGSDSDGEYWTDHVNSGLVPSNNEDSDSTYTELFPDEDSWDAHEINPDLVNWASTGHENEQEEVDPTQEASNVYTDSDGGNPEANIGQQTALGSGVSGESVGIGEWGSTITGTDLGSGTSSKGSTEAAPGKFNVGSLGNGVSTTFIDSGNLPTDQGTGIEIVRPTKVIAGATGDEFISGSSDTMKEVFGGGVKEVTGSSENSNTGAGKIGTAGGAGNVKEDTSANSVLSGGLGSGVGSALGSGGGQRGTVAGRPSLGKLTGGSALEAGKGVPSLGESEAASAENNAGFTASGSSSGPKDSEFGTGSAAVEGVRPQAGNLSNEGIKNNNVATGGLGGSSLGSSAVKEGTSGPFDGYIHESGGGTYAIGGAVESSGIDVAYDSGSLIVGGIGENNKASSSSVGAPSGNGGESGSSTETVSGPGCTGNGPGFADQQCKNTATGNREIGSTGQKVTDVGHGSGTGQADNISSGNGLENGKESGIKFVSETVASDADIKELLQPLLTHFSDSSVAVAEAFAGIGPDGKLQASSTAQIYDSNNKTRV